MPPVETHLISIDPQAIDLSLIERAANCLKNGGLVAFPTETVYGLGANALDEPAVAKIFAAKGRPPSDPLIVHIATLAEIHRVAVQIPPVASQLAARFWPGPLTLVLQRHTQVPARVSAGLSTVAVRMPSHPVAQALLQAAGLPIAAPSANRFTRPSATTAAHVLEDLGGEVDIIIDGGTASIGLESTVVDLTTTPATILRPGGIAPEDLRLFVPDIQVKARYWEGEEATPSPGMLLKHYAPRAELRLFSGEREAVLRAMYEAVLMLHAEKKAVGLLLAEEDRAFFADLKVPQQVLGAQSNMVQIGYNLFAALRYLDTQGVDVIVGRMFESAGLGLAISDRLLRAASGRVIYVSSS